MEEEGNAVRLLAIFADAELFLEDDPALVYRADALHPGCGDSSSVKRSTPLSSIMMTGRQSKKITRTNFEKECVKVGVERVAMRENINFATPAASGAL